MPAVDRFGRLKKNPMLGQAFGTGSENEARRETYMGLHGELKKHVTKGGRLRARRPNAPRRASLANVARERFSKWGDPRMAEIQQHQSSAAELQPRLASMSVEVAERRNEITDLWGQRRRMEVRGENFGDIMDERDAAQASQGQFLIKQGRAQDELVRHQASIRSGREAYQSRQGLYNKFFGRGGY